MTLTRSISSKSDLNEAEYIQHTEDIQQSDIKLDDSKLDDSKLDAIKTLLENNLLQLNNKYDQINQRMDTLQQSLDGNLKNIKSDIEVNSTTAKNALALATTNKTDILLTSNENYNLKQSLHELTLKLEIANDQIDDQINRSLRNTLIFRGIPLKPKETWEETTTILAETISKQIPDLNKEWIRETIERAHRSKTGSNIIVKFVSWQDSEHIKNSIIQYKQQNQRHQS